MKWAKENVLAISSSPCFEQDEFTVYGIDIWIAKAKTMGIKTILCLLTEELKHYKHIGLPTPGLLEYYRYKGFEVIYRPVDDRSSLSLPQQLLEKIYLDFEASSKPVLVHCYAGVGRSGAVVSYILGKLEKEM